MAREDILPAVRGLGSTPAMQSWGLTAAETFKRGEPVRLSTAGRLIVSVTNPDNTTFLGIAAEDGDTTNASGLATAKTRFGQFTDTGILAVGDLINVWIPQYLNFFQTGNFATAGVFGATQTIGDIGEGAGLLLTGGQWGINTAGASKICRIVDFLSKNGISIQMDTQAVGRTAVFAFNTTQLLSGAVTA